MSDAKDEALSILRIRYAALMRRRQRNRDVINDAKADELSVDREMADLVALARVFGIETLTPDIGDR